MAASTAEAPIRLEGVNHYFGAGALRKQIEVDDDIVRELDGKAAAARARRGELPHDASERASESLLAALASIREQEAILLRRKESLVLRAPGPGEVTGLFLRPGEMANEGVVVATIAGPAQTSADGRPSAVTLAERGERSIKAISPNVMPEVKELSRLTPFCVGTLTIAEPRVITKSSSELCPAATIVCPR